MCDVRRVRVIGRIARLARAVAIAAAITLAAGMPATPAAAADGDAPERAAESAIDPARVDQVRGQVLDGSLQPELPRYRRDGGAGAVAAASPAQPGRRPGGELVERRRRTTIDPRDRDEQGALASLMQIVMWGMVIVLGVLGVAWLVNELARRGDDAALPPEDDPGARMRAAAAAIIDRPLGDADELARCGEFAEAIHTLLLRTLQELVRSAAVRVDPATTSREILARVPLLADARSALAGLITAVEVTHFGDEPANADDYERCRRQFHVFAEALRGGAGARQPPPPPLAVTA
jgi:Domain of unknown function (DUF4129)